MTVFDNWYNNVSATTMDDEDPSSSEGATIIVISFSTIKQVHIYGLPSSMILPKQIIYKTKIKTDKKYIQYLQRQSEES
jgi:hypothetical protein